MCVWLEYERDVLIDTGLIFMEISQQKPSDGAGPKNMSLVLNLVLLLELEFVASGVGSSISLYTV